MQVPGELAREHEPGGRKESPNQLWREVLEDDAPPTFETFTSIDEGHSIPISASEGAVLAAGVTKDYQSADSHIVVDDSAASEVERSEREVDTCTDVDEPEAEPGELEEEPMDSSQWPNDNARGLASERPETGAIDCNELEESPDKSSKESHEDDGARTSGAVSNTRILSLPTTILTRMSLPQHDLPNAERACLVHSEFMMKAECMDDAHSGSSMAEIGGLEETASKPQLSSKLCRKGARTFGTIADPFPVLNSLTQGAHP
ncbi:hypothetical protein B0H11DRAFT_2227359 [Mycena galericulata]|nr:hypothetical protein B0H11DRAFT_2227359 [Mycena galericulata]